MRWRSSRRSQNVEDRRGMRAVRRPAVAGGGVVLIIVVIALLLGADPGAILQLVGGSGETAMVQTGQTTRSPEENVLADFSTGALSPERQGLPGADARPLLRCSPVGLRVRECCHGTLLLSR
jgi:hypothetical protein